MSKFIIVDGDNNSSSFNLEKEYESTLMYIANVENKCAMCYNIIKERMQPICRGSYLPQLKLDSSPYIL